MTEGSLTFIREKTAQWQQERERGKSIKTENIGRQGFDLWKREDWKLQPQHNLPRKVLVIERWRHVKSSGAKPYRGGAKPGDIEYRIGYWTVGRNGKWLWGQYAPLIPRRDLNALLRFAKGKGWIAPALSR